MDRSDSMCSDPHWQAVLAEVGKSFDELTVPAKIAAIDAVNRRRSLEPHETDMLCELINRTSERNSQAIRLVRRFTAEDDARILEMRRKGKSMKAIARDLGRSPTSVRSRIEFLNREGLDARAA